MQKVENIATIVELNSQELDHVNGAWAPLVWAGVKAAVASKTGKAIAAGAFAAAVAVASTVSGSDDSE